MPAKPDPVKSYIDPNVKIDQTECPFREFRDSELSVEYWGMGPATLKTVIANKVVIKQPVDYVWVDEQTQPLPRSVRQYLHGWVRAEELARSRWGEAETVVFEDNGGDKMSINDMQLSHTQVLQRSAFCRRVLSACFILERADLTAVEHQWEGFVFALPEGWRPRFHIYSPGMKPGGGAQHRPLLSRNGCYLVRLYYVGAWRCVWVSDQVPVDATGAPLLPFSPLLSPLPTKPSSGRQGHGQVAVVPAAVVHLWPLLICKALLKLAAPDMNSDEESITIEDEEMEEFKIIHSLTGAMEVNSLNKGREELFKKLASVVPSFSWDTDDDETIKSKAVKKDKPTKDTYAAKRAAMAIVIIKDTKKLPPYTLPGISPGHEMALYVSMVRDVPLKKPLPEPDVPLWKIFRWVDWARRHGLYEAYDCPKTRFLKLFGLLKLSYAPHLLDVQSTETITMEFRKAQDRSDKRIVKVTTPASAAGQNTPESRDWVLYDNIYDLVQQLSIINFPSMYNFTTTGNNPPLKITKQSISKSLDIVSPKAEPMYLQIDSSELNRLKISLSIVHPRVLLNCGVPVLDYVEPAYLILESLDWFVDNELPKAKAYIRTRGYDTVEVEFLPGRHYCRLWVHSRMNWHVAFLSESSLLLGTQDVIQAAAVHECPWAIHYLSSIGATFNNMIKFTKSPISNVSAEEEFYKSYQPDLTWNDEVVGYKKKDLHWMFRRALQSILIKRLSNMEYREVCTVLRRFLMAPEFGIPDQKPDITNYGEIINKDPCDCNIPEPELGEESVSEETQIYEDPRCEVSEVILSQLLTSPSPPAVSQVCELATSDHLCGLLKVEREKVVRQHEAATLLQAHWRGVMARKCLREKVVVTPEIYKSLMEVTFGHPDGLSALMNEFFDMYPGAKKAYSVASALAGTRSLQTFTGQAPILPKSKWIPYFQGVFYCHEPVKVHFALQGTLQFNTVAVYDIATGNQLPQVYRAAKVFDIKPNVCGYMVMGRGNLPKPLGHNSEAQWQLTVLSSVKDVFHVCDSPHGDFCREIALPMSSKLHIDSLFLPNRRNILGEVKLCVNQSGIVSFRAAASSPDLEMVAVLRTQSEDGQVEVLGQCAGKGELYWPYIKLEAPGPPLIRSRLTMASRRAFTSQSQLSKRSRAGSGKSTKGSSGKLQGKDIRSTRPSAHIKYYFIELSCPDGWPLTLNQWKRVEEVRNNLSLEPPKIESAGKKIQSPSNKSASARDKASAHGLPTRIQIQPGDAYAELECSVAQGGGITAAQDFSRDLDFEAARRLWDAKEPGRNQRGAQIRKEFREQFLEVAVCSSKQIEEEIMFTEYMGEEYMYTKSSDEIPGRTTPVTESGLLDMSVETEEEAKYLNLPETLKDKFVSLPFIPLCMKELFEDRRVLITPEMAEAGKSERLLRFEGALNRMRDLQEHNRLHVLGQHRNRCNLLSKLFVDASWTPELHQVLEGRDEAIAQGALLLNENALRKKSEQKKK